MPVDYVPGFDPCTWPSQHHGPQCSYRNSRHTLECSLCPGQSTHSRAWDIEISCSCRVWTLPHLRERIWLLGSAVRWCCWSFWILDLSRSCGSRRPCCSEHNLDHSIFFMFFTYSCPLDGWRGPLSDIGEHPDFIWSTGLWSRQLLWTRISPESLSWCALGMWQGSCRGEVLDFHLHQIDFLLGDF